ncbi:MAG: ribonuclease P protein subunit [Thermoplasmata archaeon]|nr:ribonuclease P protein subunit [Thermoplasmata archaeon]
MSLDAETTGTRSSRALLGEIIGLPVRITEAPGLQALPWDGVIADETLRTLVIRRPGATRLRRVAKSGLRAILVKDGDEVPLIGEVLRVRPEDRTKLLALGGRRRSR